MSPSFELIPIGTELILGRIEDTNTRFLATEISKSGFRIRRVTTVPDDALLIADAIEEAVEGGASHIITTGGLGPTPDDMTVSTLAGMIGCGTVVDENLLTHFERRLRRKGVQEISEHMRKVATIPEIAVAAPNPNGWGHCITLDYRTSRLFVLPGPPREVSSLFLSCISPELDKLQA